MNYELLDLDTVVRAIGRGVVFYGVDAAGDPLEPWDGTVPLRLQHLGDTEGDITFTPNDTQATLTLPEISGDAVYDAVNLGENPTLEIPLFLADPDLLPIVSPKGSCSAGVTRVCDVKERTLVVFPEKLFELPAGCTYADLAYTLATGWTLNGVALDAAHETLLDLAIWLWRGYFTRPTRTFRGGHGDAGKNIETVTFQLMMSSVMPEGHKLYTCGDPAAANILLEGTS
jgi:hypothetical protein